MKLYKLDPVFNFSTLGGQMVKPFFFFHLFYDENSNNPFFKNLDDSLKRENSFYTI